MQGADSFIWSPAGCSTGYTGFYDAFNNQVSLVVCNNSGHLLLQPIRCNVGIGTGNPTDKLDIYGNDTNGAIVVRGGSSQTGRNVYLLSGGINAAGTLLGVTR
jgi:hypothetical protein